MLFLSEATEHSQRLRLGMRPYDLGMADTIAVAPGVDEIKPQ
jgi:hypothetical protein